MSLAEFSADIIRRRGPPGRLSGPQLKCEMAVPIEGPDSIRCFDSPDDSFQYRLLRQSRDSGISSSKVRNGKICPQQFAYKSASGPHPKFRPPSAFDVIKDESIRKAITVSFAANPFESAETCEKFAEALNLPETYIRKLFIRARRMVLSRIVD